MYFIVMCSTNYQKERRRQLKQSEHLRLRRCPATSVYVTALSVSDPNTCVYEDAVTLSAHINYIRG
jgi:hypothetical protein